MTERETPVRYAHADRRTFGLPPHLLVLTLAGLAAVAALVLISGGHLVVGLVLLTLAILGAVLFLEEARRRRESRLESAVADGVDRARDRTRFAVAAVRTWGRTGGRVARLRLSAKALLGERAAIANHLLAHPEDEAAAARLRELDAQLQTAAAAAQDAIGEARSQVAEERLSASQTQIIPPQ